MIALFRATPFKINSAAFFTSINLNGKLSIIFSLSTFNIIAASKIPVSMYHGQTTLTLIPKSAPSSRNEVESPTTPYFVVA